ncbi:N-acyl-D-aspartate/D-glutamate deacylase [Enhydrobacter aerosaccus]|uniref:N-acyl-D-aspartate/D-glutamate deacylase n=1 Tax=Enhydrobacter aerosaccus TaxID=225324 RepID=A0A1T4MX99_9HYPH|nr:amidohydrolase family protein [Enhydrobacter aerosaccus]SJZ71474.1 N-acyl-D-aspartate/D-glutamate deacylase [Enhydrobacter aerosaccus]
MFDLVIKDAQIFDGSGSAPVQSDLGVTDGKIAAIGAKLGPARETVKADGLALAPGIIDGHTHYDAQITWDPFVDPSPALGVTTAVLGNCGFTIAPCKPTDRDLTMRHLTHVEGMSLDALRAGIHWGFESFPQYLDMLEAQGVGPNVACFAGHSAIRTFVMGEEATERAATDDEIASMATLVHEAMKAGAVGFATSTSEAHNGEGGTPMPSRLADDKELRTLVKAMAAHGGVYMLTKGTKTSIPYLEEIAVEAKRPVVIAALFHSNTNPTAAFTWLNQVNEARARGHQLVAQTSCCPLSMDFTFKSPYLFESMESWKPAMAAHDGEALKKVYRDPAWRAAVRKELAERRGRLVFNGEWDKLFVVEVIKAENRPLEGITLAELAKKVGKEPLDCILDFALSEDLDTMFVAQLLHNDDKAVGRILADPNTHISLSDAGAHLTFFCDAGFGLHLMGHWSRELGVLDLPQAVHRLTGQPAKLFGLRNRGLLREGYAADLMLFDPKTVARGPKRRAHDLPAGAARLTTTAVGLHGVWINGAHVADEKGFCADPASRPGQVLRSFAP